MTAVTTINGPIDIEITNVSGLADMDIWGVQTTTSFALQVPDDWGMVFGGVDFGGYSGNRPTTGTITSLEQWGLGGEAPLQRSLWTGFSISVTDFNAWIAVDDFVAMRNAFFGGADTFIGSEFADSVFSYDGADTITPGGGADIVDAGAGDDTVRSAGLVALATYNGGEGADTLSVLNGQEINLFGDYYTFASDYTFGTLTSFEALSFEENTATDRIAMFTAAQAASGLASNLQVIGGAGVDVIAVFGSGTVDLSGWQFTSWTPFSVTFGATGDLDFDNDLVLISADSGDDVLTGTSQGDVIQAGAGDDVLQGGAGNDELDGWEGRDELYGGDGDDALVFSEGDISEGEVADGGAGTDTLGIYGTVDARLISLTSLEKLQFLGQELTSGVTLSAAQVASGLAAALAVTGSSSFTDAIIIDASAGGGVNLSGWTFSNWTAADGLAVIGSANADTITGSSVADVLNGGAGADVMAGGDGGDTLLGGTQGDTLYGQAGADTLDGGGGADTMEGGSGDDTYAVENAGDVVTELSSGGFDTVQSWLSYALGSQVEALTLLGAGGINATGNGLNNTLTGNNGWNVLNGGFGADTMSGGVGNDSYYVDNAGDTVIELLDEGVDTVNSTLSWTLGANLENLSFSGSANLDGTGNALNNKIIGNSGANTLLGDAGSDILFGNAGIDVLDGGDGQDRMYGGLGDDTYYVSQTNDQTFENAPGEGTDIVYSAAANYTLSPGIEHITLLEAAGAASKAIGNALDNNVTGNSFNNILFGKDGADVLDGGAGADTMYGGAGDDSFIVDNAGDIASENLGEGADTVTASVSYTLRANFENLALAASGGAIHGTGNTLANTITGNDSANTLNGAAGADTLNGGLGNDTLIGGAGDDTFVFVVGSGQDTVTGFVVGGVEDTLDLSAYDGSGVTWSITQVGADTLFSFTNGDTITLTNVLATNLVENDPFHYG